MFSKTAALFLALITAPLAWAEPTSYVAEIETSLGNPVTNLIILEEDAAGTVHLSVHGSDLAGLGTSVVAHDPGFAPVKSLLLGITDGTDGEGNPKTQILAFLDDDFFTAHLGVKWSGIFGPSRHSVTITNIIAASNGAAAAQAYFTGDFYPNLASAAAFETGGSFTVGEFSALDFAGSGAVRGNWLVYWFNSGWVSGKLSGGRSGIEINEAAQVDNGPFDFKFVFAVSQSSPFVLEARVTNNNCAPWTQYVMELGTTVGGSFVPSTAGDGLGFIDSTNFPIEELTGAFPTLTIEEDRLLFTGALPLQWVAEFVAHVAFDAQPGTSFTLRQSVVTPPCPKLRIVSLSGTTLNLAVDNLPAGQTFHLRSSNNLQGFAPLASPFDFTSLTPQPFAITINPVTDPNQYFQAFKGTSP